MIFCICRSRLISLFQQLDKVGGKAAKNSTSGEDLSQIRYVTGKIHQILTTQGTNLLQESLSWASTEFTHPYAW